MLICVFCIVTTPPLAFYSFLTYALSLFLLLSLSRIPLMFVVKRLLLVMPFTLLIAASIPFIKEGEMAGSFSFGGLRLSVSYDGLTVFWSVIVKSSLSVLCMILLSATTRFDQLLKGLETLHFPRAIIMILSFMYRYTFLLLDDLMRMLRAREARAAGRRQWLEIKTVASMVGVLFIRSYERAERVYLAMCSRGFDGNVVTRQVLTIKRRDIIFLVALVLCFGTGRGIGGL